jgi:hypothetical protein
VVGTEAIASLSKSKTRGDLGPSLKRKDRTECQACGTR